MSEGYYGRPIVKPPAWTDLIPTYFFAGGLAGTAATIAFAERTARNDRLARTMLFGAAAGCAVSAFCLIADLKKPERFINMLRVVKPTSPMSIGVYIFSAFSGSVFIAAGSEVTGIARPAGRFFEALAGLIGPVMSVYTSVLVGNTVMPAWHLPRATLPALFAATSASSAGAWGMLFGPARASGSARRLAVLGGTAMVGALQAVYHELGPVQVEPYTKGEAGALARTARVLNVGGIVCATLAKKSDTLGRIAGALLLAGGLAERFAVYRAGCASAADPKYTIEAQTIRHTQSPTG
jgi:formate-dependent nitrite reductase membrane component NrfD